MRGSHLQMIIQMTTKNDLANKLTTQQQISALPNKLQLMEKECVAFRLVYMQWGISWPSLTQQEILFIYSQFTVNKFLKIK